MIYTVLLIKLTQERHLVQHHRLDQQNLLNFLEKVSLSSFYCINLTLVFLKSLFPTESKETKKGTWFSITGWTNRTYGTS